MYLINLLILLYHYINTIFNNSLEFFFSAVKSINRD